MRISLRVATALVGPLALLLTALVAVPAALLLAYSFFRFRDYQVDTTFVLSNWRAVFSNRVYLTYAVNTLQIALPTTVLSVSGGFAIAYYAVFRATRRVRSLILAVTVISFMGSYLALVYSWRTILGDEGVLNTALESAGVIDHPLSLLLYSKTAVVIAETNFFLPLTALILYVGLVGVSPDVLDAARDLGAGRWTVMRRVVLPLCGRAIFVSSLFVFFLSSGDYITPVLLGGVSSVTLGTAIADQLSTTLDYPLGAAISFTMAAGFACFATALWAVMRAARLLPRYP